MISLQLPWPPSTNHSHMQVGQGRRILTQATRRYRNEVFWLVREAGVRHPLQGPLRMAMQLFPARANYDMDNVIKQTWDALEQAGVFHNDRQIKQFWLEEVERGDGVVQVHIEPSSGETTIAVPAFYSEDSIFLRKQAD